MWQSPSRLGGALNNRRGSMEGRERCREVFEIAMAALESRTGNAEIPRQVTCRRKARVG
jgi:hypothetical protein